VLLGRPDNTGAIFKGPPIADRGSERVGFWDEETEVPFELVGEIGGSFKAISNNKAPPNSNAQLKNITVGHLRASS
jgi:hypothetical protein